MRNRIGYKLVIAIVLFSSLITLITTALQIYMDYRIELKKIDNYEVLIRDGYLKSITASVWRYDEPQINIQLNGILYLPDMEQLEVMSNEGWRWQAGEVKSKNNIVKEFPLFYRYRENDLKIGVLKAVVNLDSIYTGLFKKAAAILFSNAIKTFLVSGFILLIVQYMLTKHLYELSVWLKNLDIGKSFEKFQLKRTIGKTRKNDELDEVVAAINDMQANLKAYLSSLSRSEEKYRILTENVPLRIFHKDTRSVYIACNRNFARDLNIKPDDIAGKRDSDFFPEEIAEKYMLDDRRIIDSGEVEYIEERYLLPGREDATIRTIKTPLWNEKREVIGLIGAFTDVTELKKTQSALKESEDKFRRLIDTLKDSYFFYSLNTEGVFTYISQSVSDVLGYSVEEFSSHYTTYMTDDIINREAVRHESLSLQGIKQKSYEAELFHKNGSVRRIRVTETPVFDDMGNIGAVEGLAHDVTDIKRIEEQLRQAQKMEAIGTLAGGIAHDFNNILGVMLGYAEMARDDADDGSTMAKDLNEVLKAGHRAKDLVKQILAFSRQSEIRRIPIEPSFIIKEVLAMLRHSLPATITIHEDIDSRCELIVADPTQFHQIVLNLCTNAFHSMEERGGDLFISLRNHEVRHPSSPESGSWPGTGRISDQISDLVFKRVSNPVSTHYSDLYSNPYSTSGSDSSSEDAGLQPGRYVCLEVRDTGEGIDPSIQDKIFNPYFTTKETGKGTGMGLSIVHGIVESYGGAIGFESSLGKGTLFRLFFPASESVMESRKTDDSLIKGTERVLFVDDEEFLANMGESMLRRLGYSVTAMKSSKDALSLFRNEPQSFDVVITDQTMPEITGIELAGEMLKIRPDIPIILCTGYSAIVSEERAKLAGVREFALKPLLQSDISALIRKVLDNS